MLRGELYLRCVLGQAEAGAPEIAAVVEAAYDTFLRAHGMPERAG